MVAVDSRRAFLGCTSFVTALFNEQKYPTTLSDLICNYTPVDFRRAVADSGKFLYRGETFHTGSKWEILSPEPDLLLPNTYDNPDALAYFRCLERRLRDNISAARPSSGHIGISDIGEASSWGTAASIWPLGTSLSYVWPEKETVFFPTKSGTCDSQRLVINCDLTMALKQGHEVLFTSTFREDDIKLSDILASVNIRNSPFLAVSSELNTDLLMLVQSAQFTKEK